MQQKTDFEKLVALLSKYAQNEFARDVLSRYIAAKAFEAGHLYSDMGLDSRMELNKLMAANYPILWAMRPADKRWKKFLFDEIGSVAPACYGCQDVDNCFKCDILEAVNC